MIISLFSLIFLRYTLNYIEKQTNFLQKIVHTVKNIMTSYLTQTSDVTSNVINFGSAEKKYNHLITKKDVTVYMSDGNHDHGSSKVKLKSIVDYKWELKNYPGHLIAVHNNGELIAYVIKVNNKVSGTEGMVRVVHTLSAQRALIKGMTGEVLDLQFAFIDKEYVLGSIDKNSLHIHRITVTDENIICTLILKIDDPMPSYTQKYDKLCWCPYAVNAEDNINKVIVWARDSRFLCFNVHIVVESLGEGGKHLAENITEGYLKFSDNSLIVTWIALSPDGTTLGVGSEDGYIRFYQVYFHEKEPRCLHQWIPHEGKSISSFFFLDNLTMTTDAYWKFAITATDNNSEIKVWDCGTWECLQKISLKMPDGSHANFCAEIDRSSSYLVLSNIDNRSLYILQINEDIYNKDKELKIKSSEKDVESNVVQRKKINLIFMKSISEFPLSSPILSFSIVNAIKKYNCVTSDSYMDELDDYDEEPNMLHCVVLRMFIVQPKSVQECNILYQPIVGGVGTVSNELSSSTSSLPDISILPSKLNLSTDQVNDDDKNQKRLEKALLMSPSINKLQNSSPKTTSIMDTSGLKNTSQVNLMTPDSFSTPGTGTKSSECVSSEVLSTILMLASATGSAAANKNVIDNINLLNLVNSKMIEEQEHQKFKAAIIDNAQAQNDAKISSSDSNSSAEHANCEILTSGGSSPSREVQEILSLQDFKGVKSLVDGGGTSSGTIVENNRSGVTDANVIDTNRLETESQIKAAAVISNEAITEKKEMNLLDINEAEEKMLQPDLIDIDKNFILDNEDDKNRQLKDDPNIQTSSTTDWPKVPDIRNIIKYTTEAQNQSSNLTDPLNIKDLSTKIDQLIGIVQVQSMQISNMQKEIKEIILLSKSHQSATVKLADCTCLWLVKVIEDILSRHEKEYKTQLENFVAIKEANQREITDGVLNIFNKHFFNQFTDKIVCYISGEIQKQLVPLIASKLDSIKQKIHAELIQKLANTDDLLKENISRVCKNKSIIDAFGNSVLLGVQSGLQATYVEAMTKTLIPAYEKSSQEMFHQLRETFTLGIKEGSFNGNKVIEQLEIYLSQIQPLQYTGTEEMIEKITEFTSHFETSNTTLMNETIKELKAVQTHMTRTLADTIQSEVRKSFESQAASLEDSVLSAVRSQAQTPAPIVYDVQDHIKHLLCGGQVNKAFHQALLANDLSLVEYTLEKADYKTVFNPCVLEQTVLLSLIQQISADMSHHNEIKQKYLADGILNLNQNDPITREHAPKVMRELFRNCQIYLGNNPKNPLSSNVRMIMMAVQGMGYKIS